MTIEEKCKKKEEGKRGGENDEVGRQSSRIGRKR